MKQKLCCTHTMNCEYFDAHFNILKGERDVTTHLATEPQNSKVEKNNMIYSVKDMLIESFDKKVKQNKQMDVSKILQFAYEVYAKKYLSDIGISCTDPTLLVNGNEPTFDFYALSNVRVQVKGRGGKSASGRPKLHMETTRRNSKKNQGAASITGHVSYALCEHDVLMFVLPDGYENTEKWKVIGIPTSELEDPKNIGRLRPNVPASLIDIWSLKNISETIQGLNQCLT